MKVNQQFIDEQIAANKNILLSNDPYQGYYFDDGARRFYQREIDYILSNECIYGEIYPKELETIMDKVSLYDWFERLATIFEDKRVFRVKNGCKCRFLPFLLILRKIIFETNNL